MKRVDIKVHKYVANGCIWEASCDLARHRRKLIVHHKDPEHAMARALFQAGETGQMVTYVNGKPSMRLDIATAAKRCCEETATTPPRFRKYREFQNG